MLRPSLRGSCLACAMLLAVLAACAGEGGDGADTGAAAAPTDTAGTAATTDTAFLDPSSAPREALVAVPGMTEAAADAMIAGRPYDDMVAVDRVLAQHLSEPQRDSVYVRIWKPLDPTTASEEEILLIPGVGDRMAHEFEEYRPWRGAEHFRREIGKYVDPPEVERLLRYTTLR